MMQMYHDSEPKKKKNTMWTHSSRVKPDQPNSGWDMYVQLGKIFLIPADFVTFAHSQRNDQSIILIVGLFDQWET